MNQYSENSYYQNTGGGGFLSGSPYGNANGSPGDFGRNRPGGSHSLRPVTIRQIRDATQPHTDSDWKIDNVDVGQVTVVAQVLRCAAQTTNSVYTLDDGTGTIEARHWNDANEGENPEDIEKHERTYVRVMGNIKAYNDKRYINATRIRSCDDPIEPFFHALDSMAATLFYERGHPGKPNSGNEASVATTSRNETVAPARGTSAYTSQTQKLPDEYNNLPALEYSICMFLREQPKSKDGYHLHVICKGIKNPDHQGVGRAMDRLMDEGLVYSTIDDNNYNLCIDTEA
ncbi:hypothetical protein NLI96_g1587 [Meripilus lineatus]|uniref:Replication protein A C-terminal domain-containing protein n=1 Tax=Meripilus lineatus TaxID=2056292 RepID=A0AAD5YMQ5_9APHY|nr:hypothetical protein NLI96_g1587 [Physisporinus lineatus]